jgi:hypothetical protein
LLVMGLSGDGAGSEGPKLTDPIDPDTEHCLKGLSHEIDFKKFYKNSQNLA